jgi:hypothetical protein
MKKESKMRDWLVPVIPGALVAVAAWALFWILLAAEFE